MVLLSEVSDSKLASSESNKILSQVYLQAKMSSSAHIRASRNQILYRYLIHKIKIDQFNLCEGLHDNLIECEHLIKLLFFGMVEKKFSQKTQMSISNRWWLRPYDILDTIYIFTKFQVDKIFNSVLNI